MWRLPHLRSARAGALQSARWVTVIAVLLFLVFLAAAAAILLHTMRVLLSCVVRRFARGARSGPGSGTGVAAVDITDS